MKLRELNLATWPDTPQEKQIYVGVHVFILFHAIFVYILFSPLVFSMDVHWLFLLRTDSDIYKPFGLFYGLLGFGARGLPNRIRTTLNVRFIASYLFANLVAVWHMFEVYGEGKLINMEGLEQSSFTYLLMIILSPFHTLISSPFPIWFIVGYLVGNRYFLNKMRRQARLSPERIEKNKKWERILG
ncbi:MAG: hypothetical protein INQ03_00810 [Candidatus Heimdallarchaeota archaeon]|nr:hypothetical protein [Candidatus Heimdallarchaeota archaeon]